MNKKQRRIKKHNSICFRKYYKEMHDIESNFKFIRYRRHAFNKTLTRMCIAEDYIHDCKLLYKGEEDDK
jgi:hypothetical protein